jgi:hypothetical protein
VSPNRTLSNVNYCLLLPQSSRTSKKTLKKGVLLTTREAMTSQMYTQVGRGFAEIGTNCDEKRQNIAGKLFICANLTFVAYFMAPAID